MLLVARGMVRGQGKTEGYHERIVPLRKVFVRAMGTAPGSLTIGEIADERVEQASLVQRILSHAIQTFVTHADPEKSNPDGRKLARSWLNRLDRTIDNTFFEGLQIELEAEDEQRSGVRDKWLLGVIADARRLLQDAAGALPCRAIYRYRAPHLGGEPLRGANARAERIPLALHEGQTMTTVTTKPRTSWGEVASRLAFLISRTDFPRGDLAALRRMRQGPEPPAFWRLAAQHDLLGKPTLERKWALIMHGIALMTPTGGGRSAHNPGVSVGAALFLGSDAKRSSAFYSEARLNRLLTARGEMLDTLLGRMFRMLASDNASFDWREMAYFILNDGFDDHRAESARRHIARQYYRTQRRSQSCP